MEKNIREYLYNRKVEKTYQKLKYNFLILFFGVLILIALHLILNKLDKNLTVQLCNAFNDNKTAVIDCYFNN